MIRKLLLLVTLPLLLAGCFEIEEVIEFKSDGSGSYQIQFDYSQILMLSLMADSEEESMEDQFQDADETISFAEQNPEAAASTKHPDFWKKVKTRIYINRELEQMLVTFFFDFNKPEEINYFFNEMNVFNDDFSWFASESKQIELKGKKFSRLAMMGFENLLPEDSEEQEMTKMFLGDAKFKTTYIFPGNIKSSTFKNSEINGNTISIQQPLLQVMEDKELMKGKIKFRKK